jgi:hypothetical protein
MLCKLYFHYNCVCKLTIHKDTEQIYTDSSSPMGKKGRSEILVQLGLNAIGGTGAFPIPFAQPTQQNSLMKGTVRGIG